MFKDISQLYDYKSYLDGALNWLIDSENYYSIVILKKQQKEYNNAYFSKIRFTFAPVFKAFFVYCKVVKEKEYSSFLNR